MGQTYTRQSSYTDGDVITAAHTNDEFNQLLAAFASSTGHTHDGTAAEGGPVTALLTNAAVIGASDATDIVITFDSGTVEGVLKFMIDEDYFEFSDDILIASTEKLQFRDTAIYINSSTDGQLDLVADTEIQIAATTVDINGAVDISGATTIGGAVSLADGSAGSPTLTNTGDTNAGLYFSAADTLAFSAGGTGQFTMADGAIAPITDSDVDLGTSSLYFKDAYIDSITTTGNVTSGGVISFPDGSAGSPSITNTGDTNNGLYFSAADALTYTSGGTAQVTFADGVVKPITDSDVDLGTSSLYFKDAYIDSITTTGNITSSGTVAGAALDIDDVVINGSTIGHTDDTDLITVASGIATIAGELSVTTLDIGGTNVTSTAAELNALDGITSTVAELNIVDGDTSASAITVADADRVVLIDGGTMKQVAVTSLAAYFDDEITAMPNLVTTAATTVGALDSGSITSGFGAIDTGSSAIATTGALGGVLSTVAQPNVTSLGTLTTLTVDNVIINGTTIGHTSDTDAITIASNGNVAFSQDLSIAGNSVLASADVTGVATAATFEPDGDTAAGDNAAIGYTSVEGLILTGQGSTNDVTIKNDADTIVMRVPTGTDDVVFTDNVTISGDLTVTGTTTTVDTVTMEAANAVIFEGATADEYETTLTVVDPTADRTINLPNVSGTLPVLAAVSTTQVSSTPEELNILDGATVVVGEINALDLGSTAIGTAIASKAVILDSNKDYTGLRNLTITGELDAATLDISGAIDVAGTTNLDVVDIDGAVNMATTALVTGVLTTTAATVFNGGFASNADSTMGTDKKVQFRDAAIYVNSSTDGQLDIVADTEIQIAATTIDINGAVDMSSTLGVTGVVTANAGVVVDNITIDGTEIDLSSGDLTVDVAGDIKLNAGGGDIFLETAAATFGSLTNNSGNLIIKSGTTTAATFSGANVTTGGDIASGGLITSAAGLVIANGGNIGSASDTDAMTIASGGGITFSQGVTSTAASNTLGATSFNDANITNVGNIALDTITADGSTITITGNTTFADGSYDFDIASHDTSNGLKLGGTLVSSTAAELNILDGVTSTAAELNTVDGDTSASAITVADADRVVLNDGGTMKQVAVTSLAAYFDDEITAMPNLVTTAATTVGALDSGSITSNFGTINNGASAITTTGVITGGTVEATTDTAAGDNAAIGYTSAEGLILTGQGSTNDVTIKNDADEDVIEILTGTKQAVFSGAVKLNQTAVTASANVELDLQASNNFFVTMEASVDITLTQPADAIGSSGIIVVKQDGTGGRSFTLKPAASIKTPVNGATIVQNTNANEYSTISYYVAAEDFIMVNYIGDYA